MTTPRIEEMAQEFRAKYKLKDNTIYCQDDIEFVHELKKALTEAHQAGIDEVIGEMRKNMKDKPCYHFPLTELEINKYLAALEEALQDNK